MSIKRWSQFLVEMWQPLLSWIIALTIVAGLLLFRLGSLTPHLSRIELTTHSSANNLTTIINNPLNAPYKLISYGLTKLGHNGALSIRSVSALYGLVTV